MSESKIRGGEPSRVSADGAQMTADARRPQFDASTFSRRLRKAREAKGLSLQDLADAANLSKAHIWELEQARAQNPGANALCDLAKALDVSVVWLFVGDTTSEGRLSSISSREAQAQPERPEHKASTSPAEEEVAEMTDRLAKHGFAPAARLLTRLASEKARLEGEVWDAAKAMSDINREAVTFSDRAERAEAERDAATKQANENDERANTYAARADELGQQLFAERKRAEAAEGALKDTRALIASGIENLRATARDVRETERDRLKYAIMASALEGLAESIEAADRARALTGEGAER